MKAIALLLVLITLAVGTYLTRSQNEHQEAKILIEDSVGSQMAAPQSDTVDQGHHPDIPL